MEETLVVLADCFGGSIDCFNLKSGITCPEAFSWKRPSLFSPTASGVRWTASISVGSSSALVPCETGPAGLGDCENLGPFQMRIQICTGLA